MNALSLQVFGDGSLVSLPAQLALRENNLSHLVIPLVVISFVMITFAKYQNNAIFHSLLRLVVARRNFEQILKEDIKLNSISSVALIINYFLIISTCVFLSIQANQVRMPVTMSASIVISLAIPASVFLLQLVGLWIIGLVSREMKTVMAPLLESIVIVEYIGFMLFFLALVWVLNPQFSHYFFNAFLVILAIGFVLRFVKGLFSVLRKGVSWYYIILYFCTLEILPLLIGYYYITKNFGS